VIGGLSDKKDDFENQPERLIPIFYLTPVWICKWEFPTIQSVFGGYLNFYLPLITIGKFFKGAVAAILYKILYTPNERGSVCKLSLIRQFCGHMDSINI
jgi:hypothetical protein